MYIIFKRNIFNQQVTEHPALCVNGTPPPEAVGRNIRFMWGEGGSRTWDMWVPVVEDPARPSSRLTGGGQFIELWAAWRDTGPVEEVIETCPGIPDPQTTLADVRRALVRGDFQPLSGWLCDMYAGAGPQALCWEDGATGELVIIDLGEGELSVHVYRGEVAWSLGWDGHVEHLHGELEQDDPLIRFQGRAQA